MKNRRNHAALYVGVCVLAALAAILLGCSSGDVLPGPSTTGHLLVTDYGNSRTLIYDLPAATNAAATTALGQPNLTSGTCGTTASVMCNPNDATMDPSGNIWVADYGNNRVLMFPAPFTSGESATIVLGQANFTSSGSATSSTTMSNPANVVFDTAGDLFVLDWGNNRVLEFKPPFANGMAASVVLGQVDMNSSAATTTATGLSDPWQGIAMDGSGNLWVGDRGNCRSVRFSPPFTTNMAATLVMGQPNFISSTCGVSATLNNGLSGVAVDPSGNFWALDDGNGRVLMFPTPFTNGEAATVVIGRPDFTSTGSGTTASTFNSPYDVTFDSAGNLYVPESSNNRVTMFAPPFSNGMNATVVLGQANFTSSTSGTSATALQGPEGVTAVK